MALLKKRRKSCKHKFHENHISDSRGVIVNYNVNVIVIVIVKTTNKMQLYRLIYYS